METTLRELSSWFGKPSWGEAVDDVEPLQSETPAEPLRSADQEQLDQLKQGAAHWNQWRQAHSDIRPALRGADLSEADLSGANLDEANLDGARQLTQRQLQPAFIDASTKLPGHINREELLQRKK